MSSFKKTLVEIVVLVVVGTGIALAVNTAQGNRGLKLTKNHFARRDVPARAGPARLDVQLETAPEAQPVEASDHESRAAPAIMPAPVARPESVAARRQRAATQTQESAEPPPKHVEHPYQDVSFEEVVAIFNDPATAVGANIFVDARNDAAYEDGHIPGAVQADHYRIAAYIDNVLAYAAGAEKIIVYCNGGDCEDSMLVCGDLLDYEVPYENIYLFSGGWKAWTAGNMPVSTGRDGE